MPRRSVWAIVGQTTPKRLISGSILASHLSAWEARNFVRGGCPCSAGMFSSIFSTRTLTCFFFRPPGQRSRYQLLLRRVVSLLASLLPLFVCRVFPFS